MQDRDAFRKAYLTDLTRDTKPQREGPSPVILVVGAVLIFFVVGAALIATEMKIYIDEQNAKIERNLY